MDKYIIDAIYLMDLDYAKDETPSSEGDNSIIIAMQYFHYQLLASILGCISVLQISRCAFNKYRDRCWTKSSVSKTKIRSPQKKDRRDENSDLVLSDEVPPQRKKSTLISSLGFFQRKANTTKPQDCLEPISEPSKDRKDNTENDRVMHPEGGMTRKARKDVPLDNVPVGQCHSRSVTMINCGHGRPKQVGFSLDDEMSMSPGVNNPDEAGCSTSEHHKQHCIEKRSKREPNAIYIDMFNDVTCLKASQSKSATLKTSRNKTAKLAEAIRKMSHKRNSNPFLRKTNHVPEKRESDIISKPVDKGAAVKETINNPSSMGFGVVCENDRINMTGHLLPSDISPPRLGQKQQLLNSLLVTKTNKKPIPFGCKYGATIGLFDAQYACAGSDICLASEPRKSHIQNMIENSPILSTSVPRFDSSGICQRPGQKDGVRDGCANDQSDSVSSCDNRHSDYISENNALSNTILSSSFSTSLYHHYIEDDSGRVYQGDIFKTGTTRPNEENSCAVSQQTSVVREMNKAQETKATEFAVIQKKTARKITARLHADNESKRHVKNDDTFNPNYFAPVKQRIETNKKCASKIPCLVRRSENKNMDTVNKKAQGKDMQTSHAANPDKPSLKNARHVSAINTHICDAASQWNGLQHNFGHIEPNTNNTDRPGKKLATGETGIRQTTKRRTQYVVGTQPKSTTESKRKQLNTITVQEEQTSHKPIWSRAKTIQSPQKKSIIPVPISKPISSRQTFENMNKTKASIHKRKFEMLSEKIDEAHDTTGNIKNNTNKTIRSRYIDVNVCSNLFPSTQANLYNSLTSLQTTAKPKSFHGHYEKKEANPQMSSKSGVTQSSSLATISPLGLPKMIKYGGYFGYNSKSQSSDDGDPTHENQGNSKRWKKKRTLTPKLTIDNEEWQLSPVKCYTILEEHRFGAREKKPEPKEHRFGAGKKRLEPKEHRFGAREKKPEPKEHRFVAREKKPEPKHRFGAGKKRLEPKEHRFGAREKKPDPKEHRFGAREKKPEPKGPMGGAIKSKVFIDNQTFNLDPVGDKQSDTTFTHGRERIKRKLYLPCKKKDENRDAMGDMLRGKEMLKKNNEMNQMGENSSSLCQQLHANCKTYRNELEMGYHSKVKHPLTVLSLPGGQRTIEVQTSRYSQEGTSITTSLYTSQLQESENIQPFGQNIQVQSCGKEMDRHVPSINTPGIEDPLLQENKMKTKMPSSGVFRKADNCGLSQEDPNIPRHVVKKTLQFVPTRVAKTHQSYVNNPGSKENKQISKSIRLKSDVQKSEQMTKFSKSTDFIEQPGFENQRTILKNDNDMPTHSIEKPRHFKSSYKINSPISSDQDTDTTNSVLNYNVVALREHFDEMNLNAPIGINVYSPAQNKEVKYGKCLPGARKEKGTSILHCQQLLTGCNNLSSILDDLVSIENLEPEEAEQFYLPQQLPNLIATTSEDSSGGLNTFKHQTKECLKVPSHGNNETGNATDTRAARPIHLNQLNISLRHKSVTSSKAKKSYGKRSKETQRSNTIWDSSPSEKICEHGDTSINEISGPDLADAKRNTFQTWRCNLLDLDCKSQLKTFHGDRHGVHESTFSPDRNITVTNVVPDCKSQSQLQSYSTTAFETPNFYSVFSIKDKLKEWAKTNIPSHNYSTLYHERFGKGYASGIRSGHEKVNDNTELLQKRSQIEENDLNSDTRKRSLFDNCTTEEDPGTLTDKGSREKETQYLENKSLNKIDGFSLNQKSFKSTSSDITISWIVDHDRNTSLCVDPRRGNEIRLPFNLAHTVGNVTTKVLSPTTDTSIPTGSIVEGCCNEKSIRKTFHDFHLLTTDVEQCPRSSSCEGDNSIMSLEMTKSRSRNEKLSTENLDILPIRKRRHSKYSPTRLFPCVEPALSNTKKKALRTGEDDHKPKLLNQQIQTMDVELIHPEFFTSTSKTNLPTEIMKNNNNIPTSFTLQTTRIDHVKNHQTRAATIDVNPLSNSTSGSCIDDTSNDVSSGEFGSSLGGAESLRVRSNSSDAGEIYNQSKSKKIILDWYKPSYQTTMPTYVASEDAENVMDEQQQVNGLEWTNDDAASTQSNQGMSRSTHCNENDTDELEECCCYSSLGRFPSHVDTDTINTYLNQNKMVDPRKNLNLSINNRREAKCRSDDTDDDYYCHCYRTLGNVGMTDVQTGSSATSVRGDDSVTSSLSSSPKDFFVCYSSSDVSQKAQCTQTTPLYDISSL